MLSALILFFVPALETFGTHHVHLINSPSLSPTVMELALLEYFFASLCFICYFRIRQQWVIVFLCSLAFVRFLILLHARRPSNIKQYSSSFDFSRPSSTCAYILFRFFPSTDCSTQFGCSIHFCGSERSLCHSGCWHGDVGVSTAFIQKHYMCKFVCNHKLNVYANGAITHGAEIKRLLV